MPPRRSELQRSKHCRMAGIKELLGAGRPRGPNWTTLWTPYFGPASSVRSDQQRSAWTNSEKRGVGGTESRHASRHTDLVLDTPGHHAPRSITAEAGTATPYSFSSNLFNALTPHSPLTGTARAQAKGRGCPARCCAAFTAPGHRKSVLDGVEADEGRVTSFLSALICVCR